MIIKKKRLISKNIIIFLLVYSLVLISAELKPKKEYAQIASILAAKLPTCHLFQHPMDDKISERALNNYLNALDKNKFFFLKSHIQKFAEENKKLDDKLKNGDITFAYKIFTQFKKLYNKRIVFINERLKQKFDLELDESFEIRKEEDDWFVSEKELNQYWNKIIKNEYLKFIIKFTKIENEKNIKDRISKEDIVRKANVAVKNYYKKQAEQVNSWGTEWVMQQYMNSFALAYDPHCSYMSPINKEYFDTQMRLSFVGIGVTMELEDGYTVVTSLIDGGPAQKCKKLHIGDKIYAVGEGDKPPVNIMGMSRLQTSPLIRGKIGSSVVLWLLDGKTGEKRQVKIVRGKIKLEKEAAHGEIKIVKREDASYKLGIVKLPSFYRDTKAEMAGQPDFRSATKDIKTILKDMNKKNVDGIVLDLRSNGGGSLREAVELTGLFFSEGPVVLVQEATYTRVLADRDSTIVFKKPIVVLVNALSASASEILAANLQDYDRAIIVGSSRTFGKGTVQGVMPMNRYKSTEQDKFGALKVTTSLFFRITGESTQEKGVVPDLIMPAPYKSMKIGEKYLPYALPWTSTRTTTYTAFQDLTPIIPKLKNAAKKRWQNDSKLLLYKKHIKQLVALYEKKALSLNLKIRSEQNKKNKELDNIFQKIYENNMELDEDYLLYESLNVLADFIKISNQNSADLHASRMQ